MRIREGDLNKSSLLRLSSRHWLLVQFGVVSLKQASTLMLISWAKSLISLLIAPRVGLPDVCVVSIGDLSLLVAVQVSVGIGK